MDEYGLSVSFILHLILISNVVLEGMKFWGDFISGGLYG